MINFLQFSDAAKFALIAKNLVSGNGFTTNFSFWGGTPFSTSGIPVLIPYLMSLFMKVFGVNDQAVIFFSLFFSILLVFSVFMLGRKLFGNLVGILSAIAVAANISLIDYALSGASETLIAFEIVFGAYLLILRKKWATFSAFLIMIAMYFSRPQAFIFIAGLILLWLLIKFGYKKGLLYFFGIGIVGFLIDKFIIYPLSFKYHLTPVFTRGLQAILTYSSHSAVSDSLRGGQISTLGILDIFKKIFYNLYNFYKALPDILNPYLWGLFMVGLFMWVKDRIVNSFKLVVIFVTIAILIITALTIPFYRYIHPVVPLIYIVAVGTLVEIIQKFSSSAKDTEGHISTKFIILPSLFLILFFSVGQTLGALLLDSRFEAKTHNVGLAPVYVELSKTLKENTSPDQIILTNLDTWGSWYGERNTVWFPIEPKQIVDESLPAGRQISFDAIYLTNYMIDDENYYMGDSWRTIFENPKNPAKWVCTGCDKIAKEFKLKDVYLIPASKNYERMDAKAILLIKNNNNR
jgi:4-amino-4-deoxy-L-arabinose transferase-like glycosyltransferase